MNEKYLTYLQSWFSDYVSNFYSQTRDRQSDWAFKLKEEHSWRVREETIHISHRLHLPKNDIVIAEILGLFHDIGRFHQYEKYGTFRDDLSENHAKIGARIVLHSEILKDLNAEEKNIIINGILHHNIHSLPADLDPRCLFFCKLLRDADKLDIWRVIINYHYKERDNNYQSILELGLPDTSGYSDTVLNDLYSSQTSKASDIKNLNDFKLLQIGWVYGINFNPTLQEIKKRNYVEDIASTLPETQEIKKVVKHVDAYLKRNTM